MMFVDFLLRHRRLTWLVLLGLALMLGLAVGKTDQRYRLAQRTSLLETQAQRIAVELMSQTLNANLMGSISLLGLIDDNVKREANSLAPASPADNQVLLALLTTLGEASGAEGVFVVGGDGVVKSSWDRDNKPSTGFDVRFRPYFQTAMQGKTNVYAAVSLARGEKALYFAAPVFSQKNLASQAVGALVARTTLAAVDAQLKKVADAAVLLSPQGVVFASSRPEWVGMVEGVPDALRLQAIRDLKQFGAMFENAVPATLPVSLDPRRNALNPARVAVASAKVEWNDPSGAWTVLLIEDVAHSVPLASALGLGSLAAVALLLLGGLTLHLLQSRQAQAQSTLALQRYAQRQEAGLVYRNQLADLSTRLQRCRHASDLAQLFLQAARELFGAVQGVLYLTDSCSADVLLLAGASACATPAPAQLALGETLLGQCALERSIKIIDTPPAGFWTLRSGLGSTQPKALLVAPLLTPDSVMGVLELALLEAPDELMLERFDQALALLTSSVETLNHNLRLQPAAQGPALGSPA
jgi:two-component system C4-dicarboxylate transport sensor histidine kinase DctB